MSMGKQGLVMGREDKSENLLSRDPTPKFKRFLADPPAT